MTRTTPILTFPLYLITLPPLRFFTPSKPFPSLLLSLPLGIAYLILMSSEGSSNYPAMPGAAGGRKFSAGFLMELLRIGCAGLIFMEYDEARTIRFVRKGEFVAKLIMQSISPILITFCMVGELRWPITKDTPIIRLGWRCFAIAMPGLLYGLQFPRCIDDEIMERLVRFFRRFAHYEDLSERENGIPWPDTECGFWPKSRPLIEQITHAKLVRFGLIPGRSPSAVGNQAKGFLRVIRTSAVTQFITKLLLAGVLKPAHINIIDMRPQRYPDAYEMGTDAHAYPTISIFTNIIEAVEIIWVIASDDARLLRQNYPLLMDSLDFKVWNLNGRGLVFLLHILSFVGKTTVRRNDENEEPGEGSSSVQQDVNPEDGDDPMEEDTGGEGNQPATTSPACEIKFPIPPH